MTTLAIKRVLALPVTPDASTMYIVRSSDAALAEVYFTNSDGSDIRRVINKADIQTMIAASAGGANQLITARNISATGDAAWTVSFNGSADVTSAITLSATGVTAAEYPVVTVDAKGRVTSGRTLAAADIPSLPGSKITSVLSVNTTGNAGTATSLQTARTINGVSFDGSANITINAVDATARIASSEKGAANGVATLDATGKVPANQLPSFVDDVLEFANLAGMPAVGESGKIYVALDTSAIYRWSGSAYIAITGGVGVADSANTLATARTITATGDATWSTSFNGSADVSAALTLAASGIIAGEYAVAAFDAKGRATSGRALIASDIPSLNATTVTSSASVDLGTAEW